MFKFLSRWLGRHRKDRGSLAGPIVDEPTTPGGPLVHEPNDAPSKPHEPDHICDVSRMCDDGCPHADD